MTSEKRVISLSVVSAHATKYVTHYGKKNSSEMIYDEISEKKVSTSWNFFIHIFSMSSIF